MKRIALAVLILLALGGKAQKHDYVWLSGYEGYPHPILYEPDSIYFSTSVINFNSSPPDVHYDSLQMNFSRTNVSFCDSEGSLLFYSNGVKVANSLDQIIQNGDSINTGWLQDIWDPSIQTDGYRTAQGMLVLPDVKVANHYYIFHTITEELPGTYYLYCPKLLVTYIDMSANNGHGKVIYKNKVLINDSADGIGGELAATRHGNGKDWWLLVKKRNNNCYYKVLLNELGPSVLSDLSCGGFFTYPGEFGSVSFSSDGNKYVHLGGAKGLSLFDFDRCSGEVTLIDTFFLPALLDSAWWNLASVAFSPNNRFLYLSLTKHLYQMDLSLNDPFSEIDTVGIYDGYFVPHQPVLWTLFKTAQLGPDGKIYIACGNATPYYHVINNPDAKGDSCNFVQRGLRLPSFASNSIPNFPNYRLSALSGSPCDTLTGLDEVARAEKERVLKIFPNPATDVVTIDYGFTDWSKTGEVALEIVNELGQVVYTQPVPRYSGFQKIDIKKFAVGFYTAYIKRNAQTIAAQKFAKTL